MVQERTAVEKGQWGNEITWELFASQELPPHELVTAVFCVAIDNDNKVVLARSKRGWGALGGHIEDGESIAAALLRESQEEGGFRPDSPQMFAYRKITASRPMQHQNPSKQYPFPTSYLVYYWATTAFPITPHTGLEIVESASFTLEEAQLLNISDLSIIRLGYESFLEGSK